MYTKTIYISNRYYHFLRKGDLFHFWDNKTFMKLSMKFIALGLFALVLGGAGVIAATNNTSEPQIAEASDNDEYTTYYNSELGFNSRNSGSNLVVIGDADGGMQTKGNVLADKAELNLRYKNYNYDLWIGVGGYAVYVSSGSQLRFLYLTHNDNSAYNRNIEKGGLVMKTYDGSTALLDVISGGKFFSDYLNVVYRWDLSNLSAVKASFHAIYNGVTYYPFDGSTRIDSITYTHSAIGFASEDQHRAMMGANATGSGIDLIKFKTEEKKLDNMFSFVASSQDFNYDYIGDFCFNFALSERIFSREKDTYLNDHLSSFTDEDSNAINLGDGILINGRTFRYWVNYSDAGLNYNTGVHQFPLSNGSTFAPISLLITYSNSNMKFMVNTDYIPMTDMVITFKAGLFAGYYNGMKFSLSKDVTFYSTLEASNATDINHRKRSVTFTTTPSETVHTDYAIIDPSNNGEKTNSHGYSYYQFTLWTNIPRNTNITNGWTQDHYRYFYNNILLNGKPLSLYNSYARANALDSTDPYETKHATGSADTQFDLAVQVQIATDQTNYVMWVYFSYELMDDLGITESPTFALRDGSAWLTPSGVARINCTPEQRYSVEAFVENNMHMNDYTSSQGYCSDNEHHYYLTAKQAYNSLLAGEKAAFQNASCFADAKERFEAWAVACGDVNPYDGNNSITNSSALSLIIRDNKDGFMPLMIAIAFMSLSVLTTCIFIIKKRKVK